MRANTVLLALILAFLTFREFSVSADDPKGKDPKDNKASIEGAEAEVLKALDGTVKLPNAVSKLMVVKIEVVRLAEIGKDAYIGVALVRRDDEYKKSLTWEIPIHAFRTNGKIEAYTESGYSIPGETAHRARINSFLEIIAAQRK